MPADLPNDNPKTIWQKQPTDSSHMTLDSIRKRSRELRRKTRREMFGSIFVALFGVAPLSGFGIVHTHSIGLRLLFGCALLWAFAGQFALHRKLWSASAPGDAGLHSGLEFYRQELQRRQHFFRRVMPWSVGPLLLSVAGFVLQLLDLAEAFNRPRNSVIPFCVLFVVWLIAILVIRSRSRRDLERELAELADAQHL